MTSYGLSIPTLQEVFIQITQGWAILCYFIQIRFYFEFKLRSRGTDNTRTLKR